MRTGNPECGGPIGHRFLGLALDMFGKRLHVWTMSQIATLRQEGSRRECRHSGRDFTLGKFYAMPMALRIRQLRESRGLTQAQLAEKARMSRSQLAMIEAETRTGNTLRLNAIAAALGVPPEALFEAADLDGAILDALRLLSPEDKEMIARMVEALAAKAPKA